MVKTKERRQKRNPSTIHSILFTSTDNNIGDTGATSLSEALKSNKTLTQLNIEGQYKRKNTQKTSINNSLFPILFSSTDNKIRRAGAISMSDALKSNTTLTALNWSNDKRHKTHKRHSSTIHSFLCTELQKWT